MMKQLITRIAIVTSPLVLGACAAFNYTHPDAPKAMLAPQMVEPRPKIAIVLGSGAQFVIAVDVAAYDGSTATSGSTLIRA